MFRPLLAIPLTLAPAAYGQTAPAPVMVGEGVLYSDYDLFVASDGSRLFWISNRSVEGKQNEDYDIWMVERQGQRWGTPYRTAARDVREGSSR